MPGRRRPGGSGGVPRGAGVVALVCGLAILAGCDSGGSDSTQDGTAETTTQTTPADPGPVAGTVTVTAGDLFFEPEEAIAPAGRVKLDLVNDGAQFHTLLADGLAKFKLEADAGERVSETVTLEPGKYLLYCDVPGHKAAGMETTLTVGPPPPPSSP